MEKPKLYRQTHFQSMNGRNYCNVPARDPILTQRVDLVTCGLCINQMKHHGITKEVAANWHVGAPALPKVSALETRYFVLKPKGNDEYARASRHAMITYAGIIKHTNFQLAVELRRWADVESKAINK